jgi:testis-specific serine kinase
VNHVNVVGVQGILESENVVFIFLRLAEKGDLLKFIQKNGAIEEENAKIWFEQLSNGLGYIHSLGYAHRDLKCENIFISLNNNLKVK